MFRLMIAFLFLTAPAIAAPNLSYEYTGNGSSEACASEMTKREHDELWNRVLQELEFAGYKAQVVPNEEAREFTNGFYQLLLIKGQDGFCVVYRDAYQPQVPAMYGGELFPDRN